MRSVLLNKKEIINKSKEFNNKCGIYFLLNKTEIVYIGQSKHILNRIFAHYKDPNKIFNKYFYVEVDKDKLDKTEAEYIIKFTPKYNKDFPISDTIKNINQIKHLLNLPAPIIKCWIKFKEIIPETIVNGKNYYLITNFNKLLKFKEWVIKEYPYLNNKNSQQISTSDLKDFIKENEGKV